MKKSTLFIILVIAALIGVWSYEANRGHKLADRVNIVEQGNLLLDRIDSDQESHAVYKTVADVEHALCEPGTTTRLGATYYLSGVARFPEGIVLRNNRLDLVKTP